LSRSARFSLALLGAALSLVASPRVALAEEKNSAAFLVGCVTVVPLALVPLGLAFHLLFRAVFPRRMRRIVHATETLPARASILGFVNALVLALVFAGTAERAPPVAHAAFLAFVLLSFVGSHGVARALGARALGAPAAESLGAARSEIRELAVGWFVIAYVGCFPVIGWVLGVFWLVRGLGALVLSLGAKVDPS
jgi:hypothetical protein